MNFTETRGNDGKYPVATSFSAAILSPMSSFGGLYSPERLPDLSGEFLTKHLNSDYKSLAKEVLNAFEINIDSKIVDKALSLYDEFDDPNNPVPLVKVSKDVFVSELYHGPTRAFKDIALQPFGSILSAIAEEKNERYLILAATSGDTGPAALETFKNKKNIQVVCLYPNGGTSDVQRLQMVTENAPNLKVIGVNGDFDDTQTALKNLLTSNSFNAKLKDSDISLSAANSVNFGRIIFQTIYHIHSYLELVRQNEISLGEQVYLNVPSGNFGNALGGYYALKMGLPVKKIIISSNNNNVLTKFINDGCYDLRSVRVIPTTSPAMDILKSSNIERILFDLFGSERTKELMFSLDKEGFYQLSSEEKHEIKNIFSADFCSDEEGKSYIKKVFDSGYLMDPHTATCFKSHDTCRQDKSLKSIIYSTAEWTKFSPVIANALTGEIDGHDIDALKSIATQAKLEIPSRISALFEMPIIQNSIIDKENIETEILKFLT